MPKKRYWKYHSENLGGNLHAAAGRHQQRRFPGGRGRDEFRRRNYTVVVWREEIDPPEKENSNG